MAAKGTTAEALEGLLLEMYCLRAVLYWMQWRLAFCEPSRLQIVSWLFWARKMSDSLQEVQGGKAAHNSPGHLE